MSKSSIKPILGLALSVLVLIIVVAALPGTTTTRPVQAQSPDGERPTRIVIELDGQVVIAKIFNAPRHFTSLTFVLQIQGRFCNGPNLDKPRQIRIVNTNPEVRTGIVSEDCPPANYTVYSRVSEPSGNIITETFADLYIGPDPSIDIRMQGLSPVGIIQNIPESSSSGRIYYIMHVDSYDSPCNGSGMAVSRPPSYSVTAEINLDDCPAGRHTVEINLYGLDYGVISDSTSFEIIDQSRYTGYDRLRDDRYYARELLRPNTPNEETRQIREQVLSNSFLEQYILDLGSYSYELNPKQSYLPYPELRLEFTSEGVQGRILYVPISLLEGLVFDFYVDDEGSSCNGEGVGGRGEWPSSTSAIRGLVSEDCELGKHTINLILYDLPDNQGGFIDRISKELSFEIREE